jgi:hypothetical protein
LENKNRERFSDGEIKERKNERKRLELDREMVKMEVGSGFLNFGSG